MKLFLYNLYELGEIMSYADKVFVEMCKDILDNGVSNKGEKVRPKWKDGTYAYTLKKFCVVNRYDLSKEFPAITLRKVPIKSCTDEMLWIWSKKSNYVKDLNSGVWDEWVDKNGTIGKAYGYQMGVKNKYLDITEEGLINAFGDGEFKNVSEFYRSFTPVGHYPIVVGYREDIDKNYIWSMDQVNKVIYDLKNTPYSRRIITTLYNLRDLHEMNLYPCAYSMTFNVTKGKEDKLVLNGILNQRSQDILAANAWNVCQYSVLLHMLARECNMVVGEFVHVIADAHIYDRHIQIIEDLIKREQFDAPTFNLNPEKHCFYDFTKDDVSLTNYQFGSPIKDIPIAV